MYVGNLGTGAGKGELERAFSYYGPLRTVWIARNPPGFAFVEFEDPRDAEDAVLGLDGKYVPAWNFEARNPRSPYPTRVMDFSCSLLERIRGNTPWANSCSVLQDNMRLQGEGGSIHGDAAALPLRPAPRPAALRPQRQMLRVW